MNSKMKLVGIVLSFSLIMGGLAYSKYHPTNDVATAPTSGRIAQIIGQATPAAAAEERVAVTEPPVPANGTPMGVVELGASGFNSFVIVKDAQGRYKVTSKKFGDSLAYEGLTNADEVKSVLKKYLAQMLNKGVTGSNLHFVISSGALKEPKTKVIADGIRQAGYVVNEVSAQQEGVYALKAALNPLYAESSFVVDVGSGNTKISWLENGVPRTVEASGSKYFQNNLTDAEVSEELRAKASQVPTNKRRLCFLIGGVPNTLAKQVGVNGRYIQLKPLNDYSAGDDKKVASGLVILKAIQEATNTTLVFDDDANFTIGFLLGLKK